MPDSSNLDIKLHSSFCVDYLHTSRWCKYDGQDVHRWIPGNAAPMAVEFLYVHYTIPNLDDRF